MNAPLVRKGEKVTCTNGHVICEATDDLYVGTMDWGNKFGNWTQTPMVIGQLTRPTCAQCGAKFISDVGWAFHFEDETWRP